MPNVLDAPTTTVGVLTSNIGVTAMQAGAKTLGGAMRGNRAMMQEGIDIVWGQVKYFTENLRTMRAAWKAGHSLIRPPNALDLPSFSVGGRDLLAKTDAEGNVSRTRLASVLTAPTRAIGAIDEFTRVSNYRAFVRAQVLRDARSKGLKGAAAEAEVERVVKLAFDERTGAARLSRGLEYAEVPTMSGLAGRRTEALLKMIHEMPTLRFLMPFVRTTSNIFNFTHQVTPGLNFWNAEARRMWKMGGEERDMLIAQMGIATSFYGSAAGLYLAGNLTGNGPKHPGLRERWLASHQPYSIKLGGKWVSYRRTEPVATMLGLVADVAELVSNNPDHPEATGAMWAIVSGLTRNVSNKTYLKGVTDFADAISGEPYKTERWLGNIGIGLIPFSSGLRAFNPDPLFREARGFVDRVRSITPWLSEDLSPKFDLWGNPIYKAPGWLNRAVNPMRWTEARDEQESLVDDSIGSLMRNHGKMTPVMSSGVDLRDPKWKNRQGITPWERFNELLSTGFDQQMPSFEEQMREIITSPEWQSASAGTEEFPGGLRFELFAQVKGEYEQGALKKVLSEFEGTANEHFLQEARRRGSLGGRQGVEAVEEQFNQLR